MVKLTIGGSLETVKSFPSARWAWLVLVGQGQIFRAVKGSSIKIAGSRF